MKMKEENKETGLRMCIENENVTMWVTCVNVSYI